MRVESIESVADRLLRKRKENKIKKHFLSPHIRLNPSAGTPMRFAAAPWCRVEFENKSGGGRRRRRLSVETKNRRRGENGKHGTRAIGVSLSSHLELAERARLGDLDVPLPARARVRELDVKGHLE